MRNFEVPEIEIVKLTILDVITTSRDELPPVDWE